MLAIKIALTILCSSLYSHKLKYLFTLLSNQNGYLDESSFVLFSQYINDIFKYFEKENFPQVVNEENKMKIFDFTTLIDLNKFIENLTNFDKHNDFNSWIVIYHRLFDADSITHNISCDSCQKNSFTGFRYKCKICSNYNQCQECFWTGKKSKNHDPDSHPCKEYLFDNIKNQLGSSFRRSFRNSLRWRNKQKEQINKTPENDDLITKRLNLSNIVSPRISRKNKTFLRCNFKFSDFCFEYPELSNNFNSESEHKLIEQYLDLLKRDYNQNQINNNLYIETVSVNESYQKQICELENKNCELMKRILEINSSQKSFHFDNLSIDNIKCNNSNAFLAELSSLRHKKAVLEQHLDLLHCKREKLMFQLDYLIKKFKNSNIK